MDDQTNHNQTKNYIINKLQKEIEGIDSSSNFEEVGKVLEIQDGIASVSGLTTLRSMEMVEFENGIKGVALNLEEDQVGIMILGDYINIKAGQTVKKMNQLLSVGVGEELIGRVVNALGETIDGKEAITPKKQYPIEKIAPGVMTREGVNSPIQTGIKAVDSMIPIGRGQRELIIGDRQTGKTALAIDTIINQKKGDVICIYVAIGQKKSKVSHILTELEERGAIENTITVIAGASDPAAMSFLAPYTGCAIGEYFMDQGKDVLIVYDDLSKHAWAYRQISLILKRPPGREAYPGDVFYLHSRLLERSAKLNEENGGGSITALPIIETQAGDVSAYIPTNVISITDGQIYLESDLFYKGIRPALNVGLSVSRVGSSAQTKAMKKVSGKLRLDLAQYKELETFAQLGSELDDKTRKQIDRGLRSVEILKQNQYEPLSVEHQVIILYALSNGFIDEIKVSDIKAWENNLLKYLETKGKAVVEKIQQSGDIDDETEEEIIKVLNTFNKVS